MNQGYQEVLHWIEMSDPRTPHLEFLVVAGITVLVDVIDPDHHDVIDSPPTMSGAQKNPWGAFSRVQVQVQKNG